METITKDQFLSAVAYAKAELLKKERTRYEDTVTFNDLHELLGDLMFAIEDPQAAAARLSE